MNKLKVIFVLASWLGSSSCRLTNASSSPEGHFEKVREIDLEKYRGQQTAVPEYKDSIGVILGQGIIESHGREDLIDVLFKAGAEVIYLTKEKNNTVELKDAVYDKLSRRIGSQMDKIKLLPQIAEGRVSVWARDWAPIIAKAKTNRKGFSFPQVLLDFNYYPKRRGDDATARTGEVVFAADRVSIPIYSEGGNFMTNSQGHCLMTEDVVQANSEKYWPDDLILNAEQITQYFKDFVGCTKVSLFPRMPHEGTGHIDIWAKYLDDQTVLVAQLNDKSLTKVGTGSEESKGSKEIQTFLNERADDLAKLGLKVVRIPLPAPNFIRSKRRDGFYTVVRSYTNSLLFNGTAIIPRYEEGQNAPYKDSDLNAEYEREVTNIYRNAGFKVEFINADSLIAEGGAIHCVTMQVPRL